MAEAWTDEQVEMLKKLHHEGLSASQIAARITGISRNAVLGKIHRLGMSDAAKATRPSSQRPGRPRSPTSRVPKAPRTSAPAGTPYHAKRILKRAGARDAVLQEEEWVAPVLALPLTEMRCIELVELTELTCKWPLDKPEGGFMFCGNHAPNVGKPYCGFHTNRAHNR